ncbi:MAG: twin-arginine translocase subunit TatC [Candidatus Tectomicrobia bacterium]|uniref:Sec-independent protein translocase protein TatC n=1 Tax=Tectimicrobiota bacterium TaxID=2528274 RepID=A0A932ZTF8_UNCTE|nr:twin-arginine translocase subunit TatC [Candidatus Tectomicrobia bacterium]
MSRDQTMPLTEHLSELRSRIIVILSAIGILFLITYYFSPHLLALAQRPIGNRKLIFLSPTEAFFAHLKVSFYVAFFLSLPVTFYQVWRFCSPGLLDTERRYVAPFVTASTICFTLGALFCYYIVLPLGLDFLLSFGSATLEPQISISYYISFVFQLMLAFGLVFEVPILVVLLVQIGVLSTKTLTSNRGYVVIGAFVMGAVLTPTPDMFNQILLAGPLLVLFEISVVIGRFIERRKARRAAEAEVKGGEEASP